MPIPGSLLTTAKEEIGSLTDQLENVWRVLWERGIDRDHMLARSMLSPATCCLANPDREKTVEKAFSVVQKLSGILREKYGL